MTLKASEYDDIEAYTDRWVLDLINYAAITAGEAFAAGGMYAMGKLNLGVSFDKTKNAALVFAAAYKRRLIESGTIDISVPIIDSLGNIIGRTSKPYNWLTGMSVSMRNEIGDIIERGIATGRPPGIKQTAIGTYPANTIAHQLKEYFSSFKSHAAMIARTETGRCYYEGETQTYRSAGVQYMKYLGAPDACELCQPYIGQFFAIGTEPPQPIHPYCRCNYAPYYPGVGEIVDTFYNVHHYGMPWRSVYEDIYDLPAYIVSGTNVASM